MTNNNCTEVPAYPGAWSIEKIEHFLSRKLPEGLLETKPVREKKNGTVINLWYVTWYQVNRVLSKYAPGWKWEIKILETTDDRVFLIGKLSIYTSQGWFSRSATGTEFLDCKSYGDPSSNAESMAFRRAAARFGLGLYLYERS